jgi:methyl-accepting chemotaxis protein
MKLKARILIPAVICLAATLAVGATGLVAMRQIGTMLQDSSDHELTSYGRALSIKAALGQLQAYAYRQVTLAGSLNNEQIKQARASIAAQIATQRQELQTLAGAVQGEPGSAAALAATLADLEKYAHAVDQAVDLASVDPNTGVASMQTADDIFHRNVQELDKVVSDGNAAVQAAFASISTTRLKLTMVDVVVTLGAATAALILALLAMRKIMEDIRQCARLADSVSRGELSGSRVHANTDEMAELLRNLEEMKASLRVVVGQVRTGVQSMTNATREIASGNDDLSRRTEQQAVKLDSTSTSMAKMASAIERSAGHARQAETLVHSASAVAARGGEVVGEVVQQMTEIQSSSQKIAEIIGVIDGIAFQTNILALNAAVEAARAGDQGRGFAVVAGEVRSLAQRSAHAAKEIKDLISHSVQIVESGSKLVNNAGETMTEIVAQVQKVTALIGEITAATLVQNTDAVAVNDAVEQLDSMTQQNAALAEQSAAAAQSLSQHAEKLSDAVSVFKMDATADLAYQA